MAFLVDRVCAVAAVAADADVATPLLMLLMHVCGPVGLFVFFGITAGSSLYGLLGPDPAAEAI